jgi:hypothetical protein
LVIGKQGGEEESLLELLVWVNQGGAGGRAEWGLGLLRVS